MSSTSYFHLGQFLKTKRRQAEMTQGELSQLLGNVHPQFISNWERGNCAPPAHCFSNLISILKIKKSDLVDVMVEDSRIEIENRVFSKNQLRNKKIDQIKSTNEA